MLNPLAEVRELDPAVPDTVWLVVFAALAIGALLVLRPARRWLRGLGERIPSERFFGFLPSSLIWKVPQWLLLAAVATLWGVAFYHASGAIPALARARDLVGGFLTELGSAVGAIMTRSFFYVGDQGISIWFLASLAIIVALVVSLAGMIRALTRRHVLSRTGLDVGVQESLASAVGYIILGLGLLIALELMGIDLSTLAIVAGGLSIGIGFGLQNVANNFVSGLIILVERPIKVGDRIEVGGTHGRVVRISARSTMVRTNDNIDIIVPNSELVSGRVTNWSQKDRRVRFRVPVGVAYGTDVELAMRLMQDAARDVDGVLETPAPAARFMAFGDSSLNLELRVWTSRRLHRRGLLVSQLNLAIYRMFLQHEIKIPFPQRDLHIKDWPEIQLASRSDADGVPGGDEP